MCFLSSDDATSTVTGISRTLGEQKYKITRMLSSLEKEGLVDKTDSRNPKLTDYGVQEAQKYDERISVILNHLIYEGLDTESAYHDALYWTLYSTEKSMQAIRKTEERYRVKYELKDKSKISGSLFCKHTKDGIYQFPFIIYTEKINNNTNISEANNCFENPCILNIKNGVGTIQLRAVHSFVNSGKAFQIQNIQYADGDMLIRAEKNANIFSFPASAVSFINIGNGTQQILHGSLCMKIQYSSRNKLEEQTAIFTILI